MQIENFQRLILHNQTNPRKTYIYNVALHKQATQINHIFLIPTSRIWIERSERITRHHSFADKINFWLEVRFLLFHFETEISKYWWNSWTYQADQQEEY